MEYKEAIEKIHSLLHFGSRPGLDRILKLLSLIGNPQNKCRFIHVAGTNGKGSVCQMLSSVLTTAGYKTGLFISPFITDFRERIQINGQMIPEKKLAEAVEYIFPFVEQMAAQDEIITEFEFVNAIAFYYFFMEKCDVVVLETGMGGLLDCTNTILPPLCSVITPIDLDHTAVLGETVEEITVQKCGIIKEAACTVIAKQPSEKIEKQIAEDCKSKNNLCFFAKNCQLKVLLTDLSGTLTEYKKEKIRLPLLGSHQTDNLKTALTVIDVLNNEHSFKISNENIKTGIENTVHHARFELISKDPIIIVDGAHNPNGMQAFSESVDKYLCGHNKILIMGMLRDKDIESAINYIKEKFTWVITLTVDNPRTMSAEELAKMCSGKFKNIMAADSAQTAVKKAKQLSRENKAAICVCGSLYLAGEILKLFQTTE